MSVRISKQPDAADPMDEVVQPIPTLANDPTHHMRNQLVRLHNSESFIDGLRYFEDTPGDLVSTLAGNSCCLDAFLTVIQEGHVGCCFKSGNVHFLPPGAYWWKGFGITDLEEKAIEELTSSGSVLDFGGYCYVNLSENNLGVVQVNSQQLVLGAGRYILKKPAEFYGKVNVQNLTGSKSCTAYTEGVDKKGREVKERVSLKSGTWQKVNAITFVRPEPGFKWISQSTDGKMHSGTGFAVIRSGDTWLQEFMDMNYYARTTKRFHLESKDHHIVDVRVQIRWCLKDEIKWFSCKGASSDIFDALEEPVEAYLRDAISGLTYEECMTQAGQGFDGIEDKIVPTVTAATEDMGGELLGFEIRELRFPLLESRNKERAQKESEMKSKLYRERRKFQIEQARRDNMLADQEFERKKLTLIREHKTRIQALDDQIRRQKMESKAVRDRTQQEYEIKKREALLEAEDAQQVLRILKTEAKAKADASQHLIAKKGETDCMLQTARSQAESIRIKASAEAKAKTALASAEAKSASLIGSAYRDNPDFLAFELEKINVKVAKIRAGSMKSAVQNNPASLMPIKLQRELAFLRAHMSPVAPIILPGGGPPIHADLQR